MKAEQYAQLQKIIEMQEEDNLTGKLILFFENGILKAIETTSKIKVLTAEE